MDIFNKSVGNVFHIQNKLMPHIINMEAFKVKIGFFIISKHQLSLYGHSFRPIHSSSLKIHVYLKKKDRDTYCQGV